MNKLVVVGGGITGLAAAYLAAKAGVKVTVLEAADTLGGLLSTFEVGGNRLECFYHHAFTHDVELLWLLNDLGIGNRMEFRHSTMGVYRGGRSYAFNSPVDLLRFKPMSLFDKAQFALTSLYLARWARWQDNEGLPALDWFRRNAGQRTTQTLWEPLLRVKFGPYAEQTPLAWMIGRMRQRVNSRRRGEEKLGYLRGSLHVLLNALIEDFRRLGVQVQTGVRVKGLTIRNRELRELHTAGGTVTADAFLFTIPTMYVADLVQHHSEPYAAQLRQIEYFGAVCTVLELNRPLSSIYWLNIADPNLPFGGIIEHTNLVPPKEYGGRNLVYLSRYFAASDDMARQSPAGIQRLMLDGLKVVYPDFSEASVLKVQVFSSRVAAVVCDLNFSQKVPACRTPFERMYLAAMPHVYPDERSCNNSVRVAAEACRVMGIDAVSVPRCASLSGQINMDA
jgi:protoporphyrinogen oxidase